MDWGLGRYEHTAAQLLPAAHAVIDAAAPQPGERLVDVGCGTGNAAMLAAERGAKATGVDPAERLLEVAAAEAHARGLDVRFAPGEAAALPLDDGSADVLVSVFGVIFAQDTGAAAAEMARVAAPHGRIVITAWIPGGAISKAVRAGREAVTAALGTPPGPPPFAWHDAAALADLLGPHGFDVAVEERDISFTAGSAEEYVDGEMRNHPLWVAGMNVLEPRGEADAVRERALGILAAGNEDPAGFRVTSRYVIARLAR